MKILIADTVDPILVKGLKELSFEVDEDYLSSREQIIEKIHEYDGLIIRSRFPVDKVFLQAANKLKFIGRVGAGMENIDVEYARQRDLVLLSAPEGNRDAVGEHALGMLLMLLNNLRRADNEVRSGIWRREQNRGRELTGKTVGIIGYGNMGSAFARKLRGFDVEILSYDKYRPTIPDEWVRSATLAEIFKSSDVLSFHVPQTPETKYYFDDAFLYQMEKPFYLINTARGSVVSTSSVVKGLEEGRILGACLDVLEYEKTSFESCFEKEMPPDLEKLIQSEKVVLSPHIAGWTYESNTRMAETILNKIKELKY